MFPPKDPDFIIVGAMKAGTATLSELLSMHDSISINKKELHFFNGNQGKGLGWYREELRAPTNKVVGEATPTYSFLPHVSYSIYKAFPETKIMWILRDPVYRTFSNYLHSYKQGIEKRDFNKAVDDELCNKNISIFKNYIERSLYLDQIRRYLRFFDIEQVNFTIFEKLIENPEAEIRSITEFLDVEPFERSMSIPYSNVTKIPRAMPLFRLSKKIFPGRKGGKLIKRAWPATTKKPKFSNETYEKLVDYFYNHNVEFENLLGIPIKRVWAMP